jgi:hypothetical protein
MAVDGRSIKARVPVSPAHAQTDYRADAAVVEFAKEAEMELV